MLGVAIETLGTRAPDAFLRRQRYASFFSAYNPLSIAALGVVVITGAWSITPYKQGLGPRYFEQIGSALAGKLSLAFLLIMTATWVSFGICHRLVRADQSPPVSTPSCALPRTTTSRGVAVRAARAHHAVDGDRHPHSARAGRRLMHAGVSATASSCWTSRTLAC
jgi:hypothetical protein